MLTIEECRIQFIATDPTSRREACKQGGIDPLEFAAWLTGSPPTPGVVDGLRKLERASTRQRAGQTWLPPKVLRGPHRRRKAVERAPTLVRPGRVKGRPHNGMVRVTLELTPEQWSSLLELASSAITPKP